MEKNDEKSREIGQEEEARWQKAHAAIVKEIKRTRSDYAQDRQLAQELTAQLVAATREDDVMDVANREMVAHGLVSLRKDKADDLESLEEQPYFARVITEEDGRQIEFKLGTASFPAERIIDWRKAPISKLYYDYKEGDDFAEEIQGRDREGLIKLRRAYQGQRNSLHRIETPQGVLVYSPEGWKFHEKGAQFSRAEDHDGHLPPILSLITAEQFALITSHPEKPMVIQGIAGSGKTTVALHRLAWLLHADNSSAKAQNCLVVMFNRSLKAYVETTLPELKINGVSIQTYTQWVNEILNDIVGPRSRGEAERSRELEVFKSSGYCLKLLYDYILKSPHQAGKKFDEELLAFYESLLSQDLLWRRWSAIREHLKAQLSQRVLDLQDDSLLLHLIYAEYGFYPTKSPKVLALLDHLVIDEAQDFGVVEIRALLNALDQNRTVTIVGDMGQRIIAGRDAWTWEELLKEAGFSETVPVALTVSFRTTREILEVASRVRGEKFEESEMRALRRGPSPSFIPVRQSNLYVMQIADWVRARLKDSPKAVSAVVCRLPKQAAQLVEELRKQGLPSVRLGHRDQFDFSPGITVTNAHQVKGLEFRNVLVVEPSDENYPPKDGEAKNLLYVAVSRAEFRLDFIGMRRPSSLLPPLDRAEAEAEEEIQEE